MQEINTILEEQGLRFEIQAQQDDERFSELRERFHDEFHRSQQPQFSTLLPRIILFQSGDTQFDAINQHRRNIPIIAVSSGDQTFDAENSDFLEDIGFTNR